VVLAIIGSGGNAGGKVVSPLIIPLWGAQPVGNAPGIDQNKSQVAEK